MTVAFVLSTSLGLAPRRPWAVDGPVSTSIPMLTPRAAGPTIEPLAPVRPDPGHPPA